MNAKKIQNFFCWRFTNVFLKDDQSSERTSNISPEYLTLTKRLSNELTMPKRLKQNLSFFSVASQNYFQANKL